LCDVSSSTSPNPRGPLPCRASWQSPTTAFSPGVSLAPISHAKAQLELPPLPSCENAAARARHLVPTAHRAPPTPATFPTNPALHPCEHVDPLSPQTVSAPCRC